MKGSPDQYWDGLNIHSPPFSDCLNRLQTSVVSLFGSFTGPEQERCMTRQIFIYWDIIFCFVYLDLLLPPEQERCMTRQIFVAQTSEIFLSWAD